MAECHHGWRGERAERIETPCGHLTCGSLQCSQPSLQGEINELRAALVDALTTLVAIAAQPATAGRLGADNPTLGATLARVRKTLRQPEPTDPIAKRFQA